MHSLQTNSELHIVVKVCKLSLFMKGIIIMRNLFVMAVAASMCVLGGCTGVQKVGSLAIPESGFTVYDIRAEHGGSPSWSAGVIVNAAG